MESDMLSTRANTHNVTWMEPQQPSQEEHQALETWTTTNTNNNVINNVAGTDPKNDDVASFKSILQGDWYMNSAINHDLPNLQNHNNETNRDIGFSSNPNDNFLMPPSFPQQSCYTPFYNVSGNNPFESSFDFGSESGFLNSNSPVLMGFNTQPQMSNLELSSNPEFNATRAVELGGGLNQMGVVEPQPFDGAGSSNALFSNKANVLQPIMVPTPVDAPPQPRPRPPTLFQKRVALRQGSANKLELDVQAAMRLKALDERLERNRKIREERELEEGLNYDSDELEIDKLEENGNNGGNNLNENENGVNGGDQKGKKKAMPAKNLMAERRRRKKLNDRLYMLRSVVPRISKMDRASILGDAVEYLKELLQKVNDLQNELESVPSSSSLPPSTSFNPVTPTLPTLPSRVKEELRPSSYPSPKNQSPKVEVRVREGRAVNIHMFCARKPGLFLSTMRTLDNLGLDVQQAVISCFNGFALDVFRAEQCREGLDLHPDQIKAVLLDTAGYVTM